MKNEENTDGPNARKRPRRFLSCTRVVMILLLMIAIPIFVSLANKAVHENAEALNQIFGR